VRITRALGALFVAGAAVLVYATPAAASASGTVTCNGEPVVGVWIEKVSGTGSSGWAWTPNDGDQTQDYYRENISSSATYNVHVGCGGSTSSWKYPTKSISPQSGNADWVCIPGYASGALNRCTSS
jgi:hypothetical protein